MKNLKFLLASVICLTSLFFTSCMDNNNNNSHTYGIVLATVTNTGSSVYFTDANGTAYFPTNASSLTTSSGAALAYTTGDIAYVYFYYADETQTTKTARSIVLQGYADIQKNSVNVVTAKGAPNDTLKTDSVISVDGIAVVGRSLIATTNFYLAGTTQTTSLFYYQTDGFSQASGSAPDTLKFVLGHNKHSDAGNYYTTKDYAIVYYYNAFNISSPMMTAADQSSKDSIVIDMKARVWQSESDNSSAKWKHYYCKYAKNNY